jgi:hypothetical protein
MKKQIRKATYTPGPWIAEGVEVTAGVMFVADCDGRGDVKRQEVSKANARLIAAAPDMYEALEEALSFLEGFEDCDNPEDVPEALDMVRAALAKADRED